jgi:UDP-glucose 4-epimerase
MRALVTGGAGFIGSNVVDALVARGDDVLVLDDLSTGRAENLDARVPLVQADVSDGHAVEDAVAAHRPEAIFHLAAQIDVRRSVAEPELDLRVNVGGTIAVLEAARRHDARVVFSSTGGAIYGDTDVVPTPEDAPRRPMAPYGQSKAGAEDYCGLYDRLHGVPTVVLRYANVYGPRQDPLGEAGVVAIFCDCAERDAPGTAFGTGEQTRDFVYVGDVVDVNLRAAARDGSGVFNVGTGRETSVLGLAEVLGLAVERAPARPGEIERSCLDPSLAERELGWAAQTSLREGLDRTLQWVRSR